jgi:hypothetical protein
MSEAESNKPEDPKALVAREEFDDAQDFIGEIGDHMIEHILAGAGLAEGVPVLGWFAKAARLGLAIRDRALIAKIVAFLSGVGPTEKVRNRFRLKIETDEGFQREVRRLLPITLDRLDEIEKARLLGKLFTALAFDEITRDEFRRLSMALERVYLPDLNALRDFVGGSGQGREGPDLPLVAFQGLESAGLVSAWHSIVRAVGPDEQRGTSGKQPILASAIAVKLVKVLFPKP